jgi:hypothetical protein
VASRNYSNSMELWKPGRWTKALALIVGGIFAALSFTRTDGYGWAGASLMAAAAVVVPTLQFRALWKKGQFWATVLLLSLIQVPFVIAVHHLVDQRRGAFLLAFGVADGLFVIAVIFFVCWKTD